MTQKIVTAALIIIGDEILSGRTQDENLNFLARELSEIGINLREVRVIPDNESEIIEAVNYTRKKYNYVFTSGGVGPTHDDITSSAIAKAFGDTLVKDEVAMQLLLAYYGQENMNEARVKMAFVPSKARLLKNEMLSPSGFAIENVFVMAGVPKIFRTMVESAKKEVFGGKKTKSQEIKISLTEGIIAKVFFDLQQKYPQVVMGSYPSDNGTSLVFRGIDYDLIDQSVSEMIEIMQKIQSDSVLAIVKSE